MLHRIETALERQFTLAQGPHAPPRLLAAMRHAVFPGGARIRPRLEAAGQNPDELLRALGQRPEAETRTRARLSFRFLSSPKHARRAASPDARPGPAIRPSDGHAPHASGATIG